MRMPKKEKNNALRKKSMFFIFHSVRGKMCLNEGIFGFIFDKIN